MPSPPNTIHRYRFNLPWPAVILGGIFYAGLSAYMVYLARDFAGVIFVVLITLSTIFGILGVFMLTRRLVFPRVLELTDDAILFPRGFPRTSITTVPYSDILRIMNQDEGNGAGLTLVTGRGNFTITASYFKKAEHYLAIKDFICTKTLIVLPRQDKRESLNWDWRIWGFPELILRWNEPEEWPRFRTRLAKSRPLLPRLVKALYFFSRCFAIFYIPWLLLRLLRVPTASAVSYVSLAAAVAFLITLVYNWLATIRPAHCTEISFRDNGITQFFGKQTVDWHYHHFSGWAMLEKEFEGCTFFVLLLQGRSRILSFAIPDSNIRDRLVQILHHKKIPQSSDLKPPWESSR
jgi:hypothetical protein